MLFYPIHLPWPILLHATGLVGLGCNWLFSVNSSTEIKGGREEDGYKSLLGIVAVGLGLGYIGTAYVPLAENQLLHASAPMRVTLGLLAGIKLVKLYVKTKRWETGMLAVMLYDGLGGLWVAWYLSTLGGKVAGYA